MTTRETSSAGSSKQNPPFSVRALFKNLFVQERESLYILLIIAGITLAGFVLRVLVIHRPIAYDEAYTFINFASRPFKHILADYSAPNNHIFHTILVGLGVKLALSKNQ